MVTTITCLSMSAICTNGIVRGGKTGYLTDGILPLRKSGQSRFQSVSVSDNTTRFFYGHNRRTEGVDKEHMPALFITSFIKT